MNYYPEQIDEIRTKYYPHLKSTTYLDHAGLTIYSKLLLDETTRYLTTHILTNPHSQPTETDTLLTRTRTHVLELFNADPADYSVAFTLNATHALHLVSLSAQAFTDDFRYIYHNNSHTSLVGVRSVARDHSIFSSTETLADELSKFNKSTPLTIISWPAQSNFNGLRPPAKDYLSVAKSNSAESSTLTLLDAASICTTSPPDLVETPVDLMVLSFHKIFGLPDLGAIIYRHRNPLVKKLLSSKPYFGGGTVDALISGNEFVKKKKGALWEILEDGTVPVHSILQLSCALDTHMKLFGNWHNIRQHTMMLRNKCMNMLNKLKYDNGRKMVLLYEKVDHNDNDYGPIIALNLLDENGDYVGYYGFQTYTVMKNIFIRCGTLCNIGGVQDWTGLDDKDIRHMYNLGHRCGDQMDIMSGKPTGVVRVSFGAMNTVKEVEYFVNIVEEFLVNEGNGFIKNKSESHISECRIEKLTIYPVKSLPGINVETSNVGENGLKYDRQFVVVDLISGKTLTLKRFPMMIFLYPKIESGNLRIIDNKSGDSVLISMDVKGDTVLGEFSVIMDQKIRAFFTEHLGIPCTLGKSIKHEQNQSKSAYLLVNTQSFKNIFPENDVGDISRFRANIVISYPASFDEDHWTEVSNSKMKLIKLSNCDRCQMITISNEGTRDTDFFMNLSKTRKIDGKVYFGINLNVEYVENGSFLKVGDILKVK